MVRYRNIQKVIGGNESSESSNQQHAFWAHRDNDRERVQWLTERTDLMISSGSCAHDLFVSLPFNSIGDVEGASL